jgi:hypothetical protein
VNTSTIKKEKDSIFKSLGLLRKTNCMLFNIHCHSFFTISHFLSYSYLSFVFISIAIDVKEKHRLGQKDNKFVASKDGILS